MDFNVAGYKEEIVELALKDENGNPVDDIGNNWFIGQPIRVWYDYEKIGIYQADEEALANSQEQKVPGEIRLNDLDGDGLITPDDRKILGTDTPDFYGGFNNKFSYKGLELGVFFYFRQYKSIENLLSINRFIDVANKNSKGIRKLLPKTKTRYRCVYFF